MRSNEDYSDPSSEIYRLSEATGGRGSFDAFMSGMVRQRAPGTFCVYSSADPPHLQPGAPWVGDHAFGPGYGYQ